MKLKHTIILLVLALGMAAYVQFVDKKIPTTKEAQEKKGRLFDFDRDKITAIAIKTPENKIELKKTGQDWRVEIPILDIIFNKPASRARIKFRLAVVTSSLTLPASTKFSMVASAK